MEKYMKYLPKGLLFAYMVKMLVIAPTFSDMGILLGLVSVVGIEVYLERQKTIQDIQEACGKQIEEIKVVVNKQNEVIAQFAIEFGKLKNDVGGLRIKQDFQKIDGMGKRVG